jgi:hypothetical protein
VSRSSAAQKVQVGARAPPSCTSRSNNSHVPKVEGHLQEPEHLRLEHVVVDAEERRSSRRQHRGRGQAVRVLTPTKALRQRRRQATGGAQRHRGGGSQQAFLRLHCANQTCRRGGDRRNRTGVISQYSHRQTPQAHVVHAANPRGVQPRLYERMCPAVDPAPAKGIHCLWYLYSSHSEAMDVRPHLYWKTYPAAASASASYVILSANPPSTGSPVQDDVPRGQPRRGERERPLPVVVTQFSQRTHRVRAHLYRKE